MLINAQQPLDPSKVYLEEKTSQPKKETIFSEKHPIDLFEYKSVLDFPAEEVFGWHALPGAFERLTPPWEDVKVVERTDGIHDNATMTLEIKFGPCNFRWKLKHHNYVAERQFCDTQVEGPFTHWKHTHRFIPSSSTGCLLEDSISYQLPFGHFGRMLFGSKTRDELLRLFQYRHQQTKNDLFLHNRYSKGVSMKILIAGSSGLIGSALLPFLTTGGHTVVKLLRTPEKEGGNFVLWDPGSGKLNPADLEGFDAIINLAGDNIGSARWTPEKKKAIRNSRIESTALLVKAIKSLKKPPKVFLNASAIGFYGNQGDRIVDETNQNGEGFLAEVCRDWEAAVEPLKKNGTRVVLTRFGVVLSPKGGALANMLMPFKFGLGGKVGSGHQYMSWVTTDEIVGAILHILNTESLSGPVNVVSPEPVTNYEFTKTLGKLLHRPTILPMPAQLARLALGEMADELLLSSTRVKPSKLQQSGYKFLYPKLEGALQHILGG